MSSPKIPEGFRFWTSEPEYEDAWQLACDYKKLWERSHAQAFVRVRVIPVQGVHWIATREESTA